MPCRFASARDQDFRFDDCPPRKKGAFPRRVRVSTNSVAWMAAEIDAYIADLAASRGDGR
ncbi:helix-turn-helix transcriptional regulator [Sphingomonas flavalba]|uniref:helix-turn-helix transcriptional regulator n=1 Tax=Sphingomonas flavalba TaxID=2559804 RepID=UPI001EF02526|nr:AlpA family phage regulatory protein [Sphingomonas flavalba]